MSGQQRDPTQEAEFREKLDKLMELSNYVCFQEPGEEPGIYGGEVWTEDYGVYGHNGAHYCRFSGPNGAEGVHLFYPDGSYCYISPRGTKYYETQNGFSQVTMRDGIKRVVTRAGEATFPTRTCPHDERL